MSTTGPSGRSEMIFPPSVSVLICLFPGVVFLTTPPVGSPVRAPFSGEEAQLWRSHWHPRAAGPCLCSVTVRSFILSVLWPGCDLRTKDRVANPSMNMAEFLLSRTS